MGDENSASCACGHHIGDCDRVIWLSDMTTDNGIFMSTPYRGRIYIAERSRKGLRGLLWSMMLEHDGVDMPIDAREVPLIIRRQAYRHLGIKALRKQV